MPPHRPSVPVPEAPSGEEPLVAAVQPGPASPELAVLVAQFQKLAAGYRFMAERTYAPEHGGTFRHVAEDIEGVLKRHAATVDVLASLKQALAREIAEGLRRERGSTPPAQPEDPDLRW